MDTFEYASNVLESELNKPFPERIADHAKDLQALVYESFVVADFISDEMDVLIVENDPLVIPADTDLRIEWVRQIEQEGVNVPTLVEMFDYWGYDGEDTLDNVLWLVISQYLQAAVTRSIQTSLGLEPM